MNKKSELKLKAELLNELRRVKRVGPQTIVANEYPLGKSGVRADLALFGRNFVGIEIKSELDTLRRLDRQMDVYKTYFERFILVVAEKHLPRAYRYRDLGVEVWVSFGSSSVSQYSKPDHSKWPVPTNFSDLLTLEELRKFGTCLGDGSLTVDKTAFRQAFRRRFAETSSRFWTSAELRKIEPSDFTSLSRVADRKEAAREIAKLRASKWTGWAEHLKSSSN